MNNIKILLVEDQEIAQKAAQNVLQKLGCRVDIAPDGKKALELFKTHPYDLVLMDIGLSERDGIEVTREMRKIEGNSQHVPIVALTAHFDESHEPCCLVAGMDDFLLKPLTKENSQRIIKKFIRKQEKK